MSRGRSVSIRPVAVTLGRLLRDAGFDGATLRERLGGVLLPRATPSASDVVRRRLSGDGRLQALIRLWHLDLPIPAREAASALEPIPLDGLLTAGLLEERGDGIGARVRISPFDPLLVAHDRNGSGRTPRHHVLGIGQATRMLAAQTVRRPIGRALDVGTGGGAQALLAARHAELVVATDVSDRAAWFARLNIGLNGVARMDIRVGDGFAPVREEGFDLIVSNPPFVISPGRSYDFRDAGRRGDAFSRTIVRDAAEHLATGGHASILVDWIVRDGEGETSAPRAWLADLPCDVLLLHHGTSDPVAYVEEWLVEPGPTAPKARARAFDRWLRYLEGLGVVSIGSASIVMRRTGGSARIRVERLGAFPDDGSAQLERMLDGMGRVSGPHDLLRSRPRLVDGHRIEQHLAFDAGAYTAHPARITLERSAGVVADVPADLLETLFAFDGMTSTGQILDRLAEARGTDVGELRHHALPVILGLFDRGFLDLLD